MAEGPFDSLRAGAVCIRHSNLEPFGIRHSPVRLSLRTEESLGKILALHAPWRSSRLPQRRQPAGDAASSEHPLGRIILFTDHANVWASCTRHLCRLGLRLRVLRRDPLRDTPFRHETRNLAMVETVSSSSSLSRRSHRLWSQFAPLVLRFSNHTKIIVVRLILVRPRQVLPIGCELARGRSSCMSQSSWPALTLVPPLVMVVSRSLSLIFAPTIISVLPITPR